MADKFKILDLTQARKVYVVGDIHGCFSKLQAELDKLGFDPTQDHLVSTGDLVDRGPESEQVLEWLNKPWFHAVLGNHDEWAATRQDRKTHKKHGGKWFWKLYYSGNSQLHYDISAKLNTLPIILEVHVPSGKRIGVIHSCFVGHHWDMAETFVDFYQTEMIWGRSHLKKAMINDMQGDPNIVPGIDHVYYGHNVMNKPFTSGNQSWIDTGACFDDGGYFTIVDIT